jgi:hypothetical protein
MLDKGVSSVLDTVDNYFPVGFIQGGMMMMMIGFRVASLPENQEHWKVFLPTGWYQCSVPE